MEKLPTPLSALKESLEYNSSTPLLKEVWNHRFHKSAVAIY